VGFIVPVPEDVLKIKSPGFVAPVTGNKINDSSDFKLK